MIMSIGKLIIIQYSNITGSELFPFWKWYNIKIESVTKMNINSTYKTCDNCKYAIFLGKNKNNIPIYGCKKNEKEICPKYDHK